ncbi:hypothetical protein M569_06207, partial [Genlisea aurea]
LQEDQELECMLKKEQELEVGDGFPFPISRAEAVEWMLNMVAYVSFSPQTAVLATNYLDRFLIAFKKSNADDDKPWITHLAAVACLSLAAKVEETHVPLLLHLQVESKYVFEPKTIQRMELLVLSTLEWKMNPVTPLTFLHHLSSQMGRFFITRCESLLLSVLADCRFMGCSPSSLAAATMVYVMPSIAGQVAGILGMEQEKVEEWCRLMEEVEFNKRIWLDVESPMGVVDISFSSDTSFSVDDFSAASVSSSPAP